MTSQDAGITVRMTYRDARELRVAICDSQGSDFSNYVCQQLGHTLSEFRRNSVSTCTARLTELAMETDGVISDIGTGFYT